MITFDQSSKNRWNSFYGRPWGRYDITWELIKEDAIRTKDSVKQSPSAIKACVRRILLRLGLAKYVYRANTLKTIETTEMDDEMVRNMAYNDNLANLDTIKAIDHF